MKLMIIVVALLMPTLAHAAYQNPTIMANETLPSGATKLTLQFTGNAGEPTRTEFMTLDETSTVTSVRHGVDATIKKLNKLRAIATAPQLAVNQTINALDPGPTVPTACQIWQRKYRNYLKLKESALASAVATDIAARKADLEATYTAACGDDENE